MKPVIAILVLAVASCGSEPIIWDDISGGSPPREPMGTGVVTVIPGERVCEASIRSVQSEATTFAVWWSVRPDSSAVLMLARSADGAGWEPPVAADTTDRSARGCGRHPPAISADSQSGYVHLAYFVEPAQGSGIFYAHSMDGGRTLHAPVPIIFGRNASRVSIASRGSRVAVAYEDPNSVQPSIGLALSRTMGHIFENRTRASGENVRAKQPVVAIAGDTISVWWSIYSANPTVSATRPGYRKGRWR